MIIPEQQNIFIKNTQRYCVDCKYSTTEDASTYYCTKQISLVTGKPRKTNCTFERLPTGHCMRQGINWTPRTK